MSPAHHAVVSSFRWLRGVIAGLACDRACTRPYLRPRLEPWGSRSTTVSIRSKRLDALVALIEARGRLSIQDVQDALKIPSPTLRRYLMALEDRRIIVRSRGALEHHRHHGR